MHAAIHHKETMKQLQKKKKLLKLIAFCAFGFTFCLWILEEKEVETKKINTFYQSYRDIIRITEPTTKLGTVGVTTQSTFLETTSGEFSSPEAKTETQKETSTTSSRLLTMTTNSTRQPNAENESERLLSETSTRQTHLHFERQGNDQRLLFPRKIIADHLARLWAKPWSANNTFPFTQRPMEIHKLHRDTGIPQEFMRAMSVEEYENILDILNVFHSAMSKNNLTYFIAAGTLLGSYRHHGIIPWDDDVDVYILSEQKYSVWKVLENLSPEYSLYTNSMRWKFFSLVSHSIDDHEWRFPFLDICMLDDYGDLLADADKDYMPRFHFPKDWIYPLRLRPFGSLMLQAPKNTEQVLQQSYTMDICINTPYNHRKEEKVIWAIKISCDKLRKYYLFVERDKVAGGTKETLRRGAKLISWHFEEDFHVP